MTKKVMKLIDERIGLMECKVCGMLKVAGRLSKTKWKKGNWKCINGCRLWNHSKLNRGEILKNLEILSDEHVRLFLAIILEVRPSIFDEIKFEDILKRIDLRNTKNKIREWR